MSQRTNEKEVLRKMTHTMNSAISKQSGVTQFGAVMSSAKFVTDDMIQDVVTKNGSKYDKVSQIMAAVKAQITTFGNPTEKFNKFVLLLHEDLNLQVLAQELLSESTYLG